MTFTFPLLGGFHPLRRRESNTFAGSAALAMGLLLAIGSVRPLDGVAPIELTPRTTEPGPEFRVRFIPEITTPEPLAHRNPASRVDLAKWEIPEPVPLDEMPALQDFPDLDPLPSDGAGDPFAFAPGPFPTSGSPAAYAGEDPSPQAEVPVDEYPVLVTMPTPEYPEIAQAAGIEGTVLLRILVTKEGTVKTVLVDEGVELLTESAVAAASQAVFRPALRDGRPIAVWVAIPVKYQVD